mmetsp:Transcript_49403/g.159033  ORF Transcript_49403/g.159033 Transcript_49403/m.159033 type:complete len:316 (+) Transcript_49403:138-1085(+)
MSWRRRRGGIWAEFLGPEAREQEAERLRRLKLERAGGAARAHGGHLGARDRVEGLLGELLLLDVRAEAEEGGLARPVDALLLLEQAQRGLGVELVQPRGRKVRLREHRDGVAPAVEQGAPPHVLDQPGLVRQAEDARVKVRVAPRDPRGERRLSLAVEGLARHVQVEAGRGEARAHRDDLLHPPAEGQRGRLGGRRRKEEGDLVRLGVCGDRAEALEQVGRGGNHRLVDAQVIRAAEALCVCVEAVAVEPHHTWPLQIDDRRACLLLVPLHLIADRDRVVRAVPLCGGASGHAGSVHPPGREGNGKTNCSLRRTV